MSAKALGVHRQRVAVVLKLRAELGGELALQQQAWPLEVIAAARDRAGAGAEAPGELADDRVIGHQTTALLIRRGAKLG
ncbi:hypothetical protein D3C85_1577830 [compost metagenome]